MTVKVNKCFTILFFMILFVISNSFSNAFAQNNPPLVPNAPYPPDNTTSHYREGNLYWGDGEPVPDDPDAGDEVTFFVYLEANNPEPQKLLWSGQTSHQRCYASGLNPNTEYFWKVIAVDQDSAISEGPVWRFITESEPEEFEPPAILEEYNTPGSAPSGLAWDGETFWSCDEETNKIYKHQKNSIFVVEESYDSPIYSVVSSRPTDLTWDGNNLWASIYGNGGELVKFDESISVIERRFGYAIEGLASSNNDILFGSSWTGCIELNQSNGRDEIYNFGWKKDIMGMHWDGEFLYVAVRNILYQCYYDNSNPEYADITPVAQFKFDFQVADITDDGQSLWILNKDEGKMLRLDHHYMNLPPDAPILTSPANNTVIQDNTPEFTWSIPFDANNDSLHFSVEIDRDNYWDNINFVFESNQNPADFTPEMPALQSTGTATFNMSTELPDGTWYWRVRAWDGQEFSNYSEVSSFDINLNPIVKVTIKTSHPITLGPGYKIDSDTYFFSKTFNWLIGSSHQAETWSPQGWGEPDHANGTCRFVWTSWSDSGAMAHTYIVPNKDDTLIANFKAQALLSVQIVPADAGTVLTSAPDNWFDFNSSATLWASPAAEYKFDRWEGDVSRSDTSATTVLMNREKTVIAYFSLISSDENTAPQAPALITPIGNQYVISSMPEFSWKVPIDKDNDSLHFKLEIDTDKNWYSIDRVYNSLENPDGFTPAPPFEQNIGEAKYTLKTPLADGIWLWRVAAWDGLVYGNYSNIGVFKVDTTPPGTPTHISLKKYQNGFNLTWAGNTEPDVHNYRIYRSNDQGFNPTNDNLLVELSHYAHHGYFDSSVNEGVNYYYRISACDSAGNESLPSEEINGKINSPDDNIAPQAPVLIAPTNNQYMNSNIPELTWKVPIDVDNDSLHFVLEIDKDNNWDSIDYEFNSQLSQNGFTPAPPLEQNAEEAKYRPRMPLADGGWYWRVTAWDGLVYGNPSSVSVFRVDTTPPATPDHFSVRVGQSEVCLAWYENTEPDIKNYRIYRSTTSGFSLTNANLLVEISHHVQSYEYTDLDIKLDLTYYYRISACDSAGNESLPSQQLFAKLISSPTISVQPSEITFGSVQIGEYADRQLTIKNTGNDTLEISALITNLYEFTVISDSFLFRIPPEQNSAFTVRFQPYRITDYTSDLRILNNSNANPKIIMLYGTGEKQQCTARPNPFTPNDDGFNDYVEFSFTGMSENESEILIFDRAGKLVRILDSSNGPNYRWNGLDNKGDYLEPGVYIYIVRVNRAKRYSGTITLML